LSEKKQYFKITSWKQVIIFSIVVIILFYLFDVIDLVFGTDTDAFLGGIYDKLFDNK